jgi:cell division protein FtsI/penicillin-binding protein 2
MKSFLVLVPLVLVGLLQIAGSAAGSAPQTPAKTKAGTKAPSKRAAKAAARPPAKTQAQSSARVPAKAPAKKTAAKRKPRYQPAPPVDPTLGDNVDGDDLAVRRAVVEALGVMNGAVVAVDPSNGRVLSIVNQKLALKSGFIPCSTIKLVTGLAGLSEHVIARDTPVRLGRYTSFNLTSALAKSNNPFFQRLGNQLGYERVTHYAQMLGLGEKAGLDIEGEEPGSWPDKPPAAGGVGMMTAYGENILMTPLELAALLSAIADDGKLLYLQYPRNAAEIEGFTPHVKRSLDLAPGGISDIKTGMRAAVDFGTARRASYDPNEPILGKTGTCTDFRFASHMGWFGSFNEVDHHRLVLVVMLLGTKTVNGPVASGVAGAIYRTLSEQRYFVAEATPKPDLPEILVTMSCCSR